MKKTKERQARTGTKPIVGRSYFFRKLGIIVPAKVYDLGYGENIVTKTKINWLNPFTYPALLILFSYAGIYRAVKKAWPWDAV